MKSIITRLGSLFLALVLLGANLAPVYAETVPDAAPEAPAAVEAPPPPVVEAPPVQEAPPPPPVVEAPPPPPPVVEAPPPVAEVVVTEAPTEKPTEKPTENPTEKPTEQPTEKPTEKPAEQPTEKPAEQPAEKPTEQPVETPTSKPTQAEPGSTPLPVSSLRAEGRYDLLDTNGATISILKKGEFADITIYLRDAGVPSDAAGHVSVTMERDTFDMVPVQNVPAYDGQPAVRKTSTGSNDLVFSVTFPHVQYLGEKNVLRFSVRYSGLNINVPNVDITIRECLIEEPPVITETPAPEEPGTPVTDTPTTKPSTGGTDPTDPDEPTPEKPTPSPEPPIESTLALKGYDVLDEGGTPKDTILPGEAFILIVHLKDSI